MKLGEFLELRYVTEFKVRDPIWEERRLLDRARGVGRAGDERSARLLPTHPPGRGLYTFYTILLLRGSNLSLLTTHERNIIHISYSQ